MVTPQTNRAGAPGTSLGGLLGRDREMEILHDGLKRARSGQPSTILVGGDAGIGKTRLLSEFVATSTDRSLWGGCSPMGERGVPHLPLIEMLRSLDDEEKASLSPALSVVAPGLGRGSMGGATSRAHFFQAVMDLFEQLASAKTLIVIVEDLHWADGSTRDLLDFVIGLLREQQIMLVASFRTDDLPTNHPLRADLAEWMRRASVTRVDLEPLSPEDGLRLVSQLLADSDLSHDQAIRLVERSDGNPFFLEELAAAGPELTAAPGRMRDLLLRRTHLLDPDLLRLLQIASVAGTTIDEDLLSRVAGLDTDDARALLRDGIQALLLTVDDRSCRFRHSLLAEALHDDLLPTERRQYHALYADALLDRGEDIRAGELAGHQAEAGRIDEALTAWVAAGRTAEGQYAFAEGAAAYQSALELWELASDPETETGLTRLDLIRQLAETAFLAGEAHLARDMARRALEEIDEGDDPITAALIYHRLARYLRNTNDFGDALGIQERAVQLIPSTPPTPERAEVLSGLAVIHQFENRYHEARDLSQEAIEVALATGATEAEIRARNTLGETISVLEDLDRGLAIIGEAVDSARRTGNAHEQARGLWNMQGNRYFGGRLAEFVENSADTIATLRITQPHWIADHMVDTADALQMLGRWDEAEAMVEDAKRRFPTLVSRLGVPELLVARGRFSEAKDLIDTQAKLLIGFVGPDVTGHVLLLVNRAQIALAEGDTSEALDLVEMALERYPSLEKPVYISQGIAIGLRAAADITRAARIRGDSETEQQTTAVGDRLHQEMMARLDLPGPEDGWKRLVGCFAAQCDAELSRLHGRPDPEAWQHAAERWTQLSMPYRAAYARLRWAEDALATGEDRSRVEPVVRELADYLESLGARVLHEDVKALARRARIDIGNRFATDPYGLTEREREVLTQLARGATNRQIADALFISEKTASVHVSNILRKLSAANRGEAAATAIRDGLVDVVELGRSG